MHYRRAKGWNGILESVLIGLPSETGECGGIRESEREREKGQERGTNCTVKTTPASPPRLHLAWSWFPQNFSLSPPALASSRISQPHSSRFDPVLATPLHVDAGNLPISERTRAHPCITCTFVHLPMSRSFCLHVVQWGKVKVKRRRMAAEDGPGVRRAEGGTGDAEAELKGAKRIQG